MNLESESGNSKLYFPEPKEPARTFPIYVSDIEILRKSVDPLAVMGRRRLNRWLRNWNFPDKKELLVRLNSSSAADHDGAVWELYLNSLFRYLGFYVERDPLKIKGKTPDFRITRFAKTYYVEATSVSREPSSPSQKHWRDLVNKVDSISRDDFFITFHPSQTSSRTPRSTQVVKQINTFLDSLDYEELCLAGHLDRPELIIRDNEWEIRVSPIPKSPKGVTEGLIGLCGNAETGMISDLEDLRTKISKKRKRYGPLDAPFIIAILENSFVGSDDKWHRFGALFGNDALRISPNGESQSIRQDNGIWSARKKESYVEGLLLTARLPITFPDLGLPELWINPNVATSQLDAVLPFSFLCLQEDKYELTASEFSWNGLDKPGLRSVMSRLVSQLFKFLSIRIPN